MMSVFHTNVCKISSCGKLFSNLCDLIKHIEHEHLDFNPDIIEQAEHNKPECLPLSYVLRFDNDESNYQPNLEITKVQSVTSTAKKTDTFEADTWGYSHDVQEKELSYAEIIDSKYIGYEMTNSIKVNARSTKQDFIGERPFYCKVPGCPKRYKNINGIKYHFKNGHRHWDSTLPRSKFKKIKSSFAHKNTDHHRAWTSGHTQNVSLIKEYDLTSVYNNRRSEYQLLPIDYKHNEEYNQSTVDSDELQVISVADRGSYECQNFRSNLNFDCTYMTNCQYLFDPAD